MDNKRITIITGTGGPLGTGHFQRMCALADYFKRTGKFQVSILIANGKPDIPLPLADTITDIIPEDTSFIIRDMRDSSVDEINLFRKTAPVLAIDDTGPGRSAADHILDLLPSPVAVNSIGRMFIYGYNFINQINLMNLTEFTKDIDVAIYAGYNPDMDFVSRLTKILPGNVSAILLAGGKASSLSGNQIPSATSYVDILLRSRILITHFGITMFEGELAGCRILAVNPSPYHTQLTHMVAGNLNVIAAGEYNSINSDLIIHETAQNMQKTGLQILSSRSIKERININLEYFARYLNSLIV